MKKIIALVVALVLTLSLTAAFADSITIAVPNDPTNEGRALNILQANGVLKLKDGAGITATKEDIEEYLTAEIEFYEVAADVVAHVVGDVDYAIINGNYALDFGIDPKSALLTEEAINNPKHSHVNEYISLSNKISL